MAVCSLSHRFCPCDLEIPLLVARIVVRYRGSFIVDRCSSHFPLARCPKRSADVLPCCRNLTPNYPHQPELIRNDDTFNKQQTNSSNVIAFRLELHLMQDRPTSYAKVFKRLCKGRPTVMQRSSKSHWQSSNSHAKVAKHLCNDSSNSYAKVVQQS